MNTIKNASIDTLFEELTAIFKGNYCKDEEFQKELSAVLLRATGNDNLGSLCGEIINF